LGTSRSTSQARNGSSFEWISPLDYIEVLCKQESMRKDLVAASAEPLILSLLSKGESYGYAIIQDIKARSRDQIQWTDGMLYPVLHRLERNGWIKSRWVKIENGRRRKYYFIKSDGKKALAAQRGEWMAVHDVMTSYGGASDV
jgi:PadR family transcriptional regulator PadR